VKKWHLILNNVQSYIKRQKIQQPQYFNIVLISLLIILWLVFGKLLSNDFFDKNFGCFAVLASRDLVFGFLGVLFAIQIPIFILLLETMRDSGFIRRITLPATIRYREIIICYVVLSILLLISPRASFYYLPIFLLIFVSFYAVFKSFKVIFELRNITPIEKDYIRMLFVVIFSLTSENLRRRQKINSVVNKSPYFKQYLINDIDNEVVLIYHQKQGVVADININKLEQKMMNLNEFFTSSQSNNLKNAISDELKPTSFTVIDKYPGDMVKEHDPILRIILKPGCVLSEKDEVWLANCFDMEDRIDEGVFARREELLLDLKQQLKHGVDDNDESEIQKSFEIYKILTSEASRSLLENKKAKEIEYSISDIYGLFNSYWSSDPFSGMLTDISNILCETIDYTIATKSSFSVDAVISGVYGSFLDAMESNSDVVGLVFSEISLLRIIELLSLNNKQKSDELIFSRLKTIMNNSFGHVRYNLKKPNRLESFTKDDLIQIINYRREKIYKLLIYAYKNSNLQGFIFLKSIIDDLFDFSLAREGDASAGNDYKCKFFTLGAYMNNYKDKSDEQKEMFEMVNQYLLKLSDRELTNTLIRCVDEQYYNKYRLEIRDMPADGKMHTVPDFNKKLKSLWIDQMIARPDFNSNSNHYNMELLKKTSAFSDFRNEKKNSFIYGILEERVKNLSDDDVQITKKLFNLVGSFIDIRHQYEKDCIVNADLDQKKILDFRSDIISSYQKESLTYIQFKKSKNLLLVSQSGLRKGFLHTTWNRMQDKYGFMNEWHTVVVHSPEQFGRNIAYNQDKSVFEEMLNNIQPQFVITDFQSWIDKITSLGKKDWLFLLVNKNPWVLAHYGDDVMTKYVSENITNGKVEIKINKSKKVIEEFYDEDLPSGLYAISLEDIGKLTVKGKKSDIVKVNIDAFSNNKKLLNQLLNQPPEWLKSKGNETEQRDFLMTQVRLFVQHVFKYQPSKKQIILYYPMEKDDIWD